MKKLFLLMLIGMCSHVFCMDQGHSPNFGSDSSGTENIGYGVVDGIPDIPIRLCRIPEYPFPGSRASVEMLLNIDEIWGWARSSVIAMRAFDLSAMGGIGVECCRSPGLLVEAARQFCGFSVPETGPHGFSPIPYRLVIDRFHANGQGNSIEAMPLNRLRVFYLREFYCACERFGVLGRFFRNSAITGGNEEMRAFFHVLSRDMCSIANSAIIAGSRLRSELGANMS